MIKNENLANCITGDMFKINSVSGDERIRIRMIELGFVKNSIINVLAKNGDNTIVSVLDSRLAVTKDMANLVEGDVINRDYKPDNKKIFKKLFDRRK